MNSALIDRDEWGRRLDGGFAGPVVARGIGGRMELVDGELRIHKSGVFGALVDLLWLGHGETEKRIPVAHITSIEIVRAFLLPNVIRVTYAGSPPQAGSYLADALSENALVMNMTDNRAFHDIMERVTRANATGQPARAGT